MFLTKAIKFIIIFMFICVVQIAGAGLSEGQTDSAVLDVTEPSKVHLTGETNRSFPAGYSFSFGTSILKNNEAWDKEPEFFSGTFNVIAGKENWRYQELYLNLRLEKEWEKKGTDKVQKSLFMFEAMPRIFYSFSIVGIKSYSGIGFGFGVQPYHIYSENKDIGRILSINGQAFTGLRAPDIYNSFGFFVELSATSLFFPFYTDPFYRQKPLAAIPESEKSDQEKTALDDVAQPLFEEKFNRSGFVSISFTAGISYQF